MVDFIKMLSENPFFDMYPQFWTPGIGGIFMRYSYEYKKQCVELYRQGKFPAYTDMSRELLFGDFVGVHQTYQISGPIFGQLFSTPSNDNC